MSDLRQYDLAHRASAAWPRCRYRLIRLRRSNRADAPALFTVHNGSGETLGTLTITAETVTYGGFASPELAQALAAVRVAVEGQR
jgi:hypothetical protein